MLHKPISSRKGRAKSSGRSANALMADNLEVKTEDEKEFKRTETEEESIGSLPVDTAR